MLSQIKAWFRPSPKLPPIPAVAQNLKLDGRERLAIRDWLELPMTKRVLELMEAKHPGRNLPPMLPRSKWDARAAITILARIHGWERYRNSLLALSATPEEQKQLEESFPNPETDPTS